MSRPRGGYAEVKSLPSVLTNMVTGERIIIRAHEEGTMGQRVYDEDYSISPLGKLWAIVAGAVGIGLMCVLMVVLAAINTVLDLVQGVRKVK